MSILLIVGLAAYVNFVLTGSYDPLVAVFNIPGSAFFILVTATEVTFAYRARGLFEPAEPMHTTWTLILLSACCRLSGAAFTQALSAPISWNFLVIVKLLQPERPQVLHSIGVILTGPAAMALLAAGLMRVLVLKRRLGILGGLTLVDKSFIAAILVFTVRQLMDIGGVLLGNRAELTVTQVVLWFSDPLLALLLIQAVSIRRSVLNMGQGLVARCWGMMALGVAFTSAGDVVLWAETHGFIPVVISPLGWFIWFFAVTAFASAPCYQVQAAREAHEGSYAVRMTHG
ncbi:MAG: hypothetical protein LAP39_01740 [Acidobacteriia bacterium]|nr:hypothetical protein [Terriglobia bacterium]